MSIGFFAKLTTVPGKTYRLRCGVGTQYWNGTALVAFNASNWSSYGTAPSSFAGPDYFWSNPTGLNFPAELLWYVIHEVIDGSFSNDAAIPPAGLNGGRWSGSAWLAEAATDTTGQSLATASIASTILTYTQLAYQTAMTALGRLGAVEVKQGATSKSIDLFLNWSDSYDPDNGISNIFLSYLRDDLAFGNEQSVSLSTIGWTDPWTSGGLAVDPTDDTHWRIDLPDEFFAAGLAGLVGVHITSNNGDDDWRYFRFVDGQITADAVNNLTAAGRSESLGDDIAIIKGKTNSLPDVPITYTSVDGGAKIWALNEQGNPVASESAATANKQEVLDAVEEISADLEGLNPTPSGFAQTLTIRNGSNNLAIQGAIVRYAQAGVTRDQAITTASGIASIAVPAGTYSRTVIAGGFDSISDSVTISGDGSQTINLTVITGGSSGNSPPGLAN
jgi:hypothetical protein